MPTLHACVEAILEQSGVLVDDVLGGLQAFVAPTNTKIQAAQKHPHSETVVRDLCIQRESVKQTFATSLRMVLFGGGPTQTSDQPLVRFDDFQFLEDEQIDANIELALAQQEVMLAVDEVLPALHALVSTLMGWVTVRPALNPLKPESFVYALRETMLVHVPETGVRKALMAPAATVLGASLRQLYREMSEWLRSQGVEPALVGAGKGDSAARGKPVENTVTRTLLTLDRLRKLLAGDLPLGPVQSQQGDFSHTVPASVVALEDLKLVEPMIKRLADRAKSAAHAKPLVLKVAGDGTPFKRPSASKKYLGRQLGEEVVRLMLESLMGDRRLLAEVRQGLQSMEPLLIQLSHTDARFFSDRQHPARQLLEKITHRSLAYSSPEEPGFLSFLGDFHKGVELLKAGNADADAFAQVLADLEQAWAYEETAQRRRAQEAARGLVHAEQRNLLAERLAQEFLVRLKQTSVPKCVSAFLLGPWAQVVAESQLRCVDGTIDSDGYYALVDDLMWSARLRLVRKNRARLVQIVPAMLVKLRQGLGVIAYPQDRIEAFFDELISLHEQAFDTAKPTQTEDLSLEADADQGDAVDTLAQAAPSFWISEPEAAETSLLDEAYAIAPDQLDQPEIPDPEEAQTWTVDTLVVGTWVDLALAGQWVRAQMTWVSPHRTLFMFISGGELAHSMSLRTLTRLRSFGLVRLVSDGRVMDNALDSVAQIALRNDADKRPERR
ncbi:DUF1631 family protein [Rhodoferax aquaticus]|uniref:DUF1631 family protein n=1 Tax=Rhodoferax aquaticus TaxID=2527691 RepID=UPI00143CF41B|nr:DUF1631 family protein [Rhodoferax aquaticus]